MRCEMAGCENGCPNEYRINAIENDLKILKTKCSDDNKEFYDRIGNLEKQIVESQGDRKHIREQLDEISGNVKAIMQAPAKRYDTIVTSILTGVIGTLVGFIMSGILPG